MSRKCLAIHAPRQCQAKQRSNCWRDINGMCGTVTYSPVLLPSSNFSTMPAEVAAQQLQTLIGAGARYNPKLVDEINRAVAESGGKKKPNRDFPGILSPDAEAFLAQTRIAGTLDSLSGETFAIDF